MRIFLIVIVASLGAALLLVLIPSLREKGLEISFGVKELYVSNMSDIGDFLDSYINQASKIENLKSQVKQLQQVELQYKALQANFNNLYQSLEVESRYNDPDIKLVKIISYASISKYTRVWIEYKSDLSSQKIFGLIKNGFAVGIASFWHNHLIGFLNGDSKASYSVYIGSSKAPGLIKTEKDRLVVDFIPSYLNIKQGDEVVTSGLDGIFFQDVKVGIVKDIELASGYLKAYVEPYEKSVDLGYIFLVDTKIPQITTLDQNMLGSDEFYNIEDDE